MNPKSSSLDITVCVEYHQSIASIYNNFLSTFLPAVQTEYPVRFIGNS